MIDLDYFKAINDRHGHAVGDECLVAVARVLEQQAQRLDDLLARYGGEEFVLLLPQTTLDGAMSVAERLRLSIYGLSWRNESSPHEGLLTVSVGIAACTPGPGFSPAALLLAADAALYEAKHLGRNRIRSRVVESDAR